MEARASAAAAAAKHLRRKNKKQQQELEPEKVSKDDAEPPSASALGTNGSDDSLSGKPGINY